MKPTRPLARSPKNWQFRQAAHGERGKGFDGAGCAMVFLGARTRYRKDVSNIYIHAMTH